LELAGGGIGDDRDNKRGSAAVHGGGVLESERAGEAVELAGDALDGDIAGGAFDGSGGGEHFAFADGFESAVELLVDGHAAERIIAGFESGIERNEFYIEGAGGVLDHGRVLLWGVCRRKAEKHVR